MSAVMRLVGALLSGLHAISPTTCPGSWLWTTAIAGALLAVLPLLGIVLAIVTVRIMARRGNVRPAALFTSFGLYGAVFAFALPVLFTWAVSGVFTNAAHGVRYGLSATAFASLSAPGCTTAGTQRAYLGNGPSMLAGIGSPSARPVVQALYILLTLAVPLAAAAFLWAQARVATRGGSAAPGRLYWLPFLAFVGLTTPLAANVLAQLWLGFTPAAALGVVVVALIRPPLATVLRPRPAYRPPPFLPTNTLQAPQPVSAPLAATPGPLPIFGPPQGPVAPPPATPVAPPPPPLSTPGGRFQRIRQLGQGGFGTVWLARDTQLNRTVALKIATAPDAETERRMLREARALAAVHHPNCVRIYDVVADTDGLCIVMQYIEGRPLGETVRQGNPLDDVSAARLWSTMAGALSAAHSEGVLHRDVKPSNILLDRSATPHLLDFGIARTAGDTTLTVTGMVIGTPDYLAPETARTGEASEASDAWQLAATVSFALTGVPPRGRKDNVMAALAAAAQSDPYVALPTGSAHHELLVAALDTDPAGRPSLDAVRQRIDGWLARAGHRPEGPVTTVIDRTDAPTRPVH